MKIPNSIKVLISKTLVDSVISHDEFVLINDVLKEHKKRRIKKFKGDFIEVYRLLVYL